MDMDTCRICYEPDNLECLCECRGTVQFVHKECLEHWIQVSGKRNCELCGAKFEIPERKWKELIDEESEDNDFERCRQISICFTFTYMLGCTTYLCFRLL